MDNYSQETKSSADVESLAPNPKTLSRDGSTPAAPWSTVPKRKPVPNPAPVPETTTGVLHGDVQGARSSSGQKWSWPSIDLSLLWRRRRKLVIIGIAIAVLLLALIIGLAVGLTVGKKHNSNLPLPTANGGPYEGDLTYYNPGLGACGITSTDSEMICAISHILFDAASTGSDPNDNPLCGMKLRLRRDDKSVDVTIVDRCVGCAVTDIDVAPAVFEKLAEIDDGRVSVKWSWLQKPPVNVS
ncbi:hypothetical protein N7474_001126 [Penicillium riverlandense]|uniref:uncharacterized protein n=1 Tax=Penicillium riverlandense TaxID=1903569 RepID=UPI00254991FC|nr:uncharacterized protein N7474_001126 [Penicillium riverlandense]KAJ5832815.1 hypothetical protein N7474_001126 [Penicillium riverlandense]